MVTYSFTNIERLYTQDQMAYDRQPLAFSVDLCSYYTAFEVEKVRTVNDILASSHHDRMRGAMLFCPGATFYSSKQSRKLYELPIDKQHKYEQNLKRIMRQSLVDVGLSIARLSDLFLKIAYTVKYIVAILRMLMTRRRNERGHHLLLY